MKNMLALLFCLLISGFLALKLQSIHVQGFQAEFCWKDSYGRGVGTVIDTCRGGKVKRGALCYKPCPANSKEVALDCHVKSCPDQQGWEDQGLWCRKKQYLRKGYPWKGSDGLIHPDRGMKRRCQRDNGEGNCQKHIALFYPKCKKGYQNFGCCICRPKTVDCDEHNLGNRLDISCQKIIRRTPYPLTCSDDKQQNVGLCYKYCKRGFYGVGPVCWGKPPKGWSNCGMGAAKSGSACGSVVIDQVASVGELALNIATLGVSQQATSKAKFVTLQQKLKENQKLVEQLNKVNKPDDVNTGFLNIDYMIHADANKLTPQDIARMSAQLASLMDPTGVAGVVAAYTYPKCSKINPEANSPQPANPQDTQNAINAVNNAVNAVNSQAQNAANQVQNAMQSVLNSIRR